MTQDGKDHWYECTECGEVMADSKAAHTFEWRIDKEPTASEEGLKHEECSVCKATQSENTAISKTEVKSPKTGDTGNIALLCALLFMFISSMELVMTTVFGKKNIQRDKL